MPPRAKRSIQATVTIDGFPLIWRLHREQQWFTVDGWKGVAIHVRVADKARRELVLEYPPDETQTLDSMRTAPARQRILAAKVEAHIREAMEAVWDPASRGQPVTYQVGELPG
jgi:hypothetical protein